MKRILAAAALAFLVSQSAAQAASILADFTFNVTIDKASSLPATKTYCGVETNVFSNGVSIRETAYVKASGTKCKIELPVRWDKSLGGTTVGFRVSVFAFSTSKPMVTLRTFNSNLTTKLPTKGGKIKKSFDLRF